MAVLDPENHSGFKLDERDVEITTTRGTGPGGQNRNKVESCVVVTHQPTGLSVRVDMRSQHQSKNMALKILAARLAEEARGQARSVRNAARKEQIGCGERSDKIRTYRQQDDIVTDHRTNRKSRYSDFTRGVIPD